MKDESKRMFGQADLVASENEVARATTAALPALVRNFPGFVDILLNLAYFLGDPPPKDDQEESALHTLGHATYVQAPYTFQAVHHLALRGYYIEAVVIIRHLFEGFIRLRYFRENLGTLLAHLAATGRRGRVTFYTMFEEFAPGYYATHYAALSGFAHGPAGALIWRTAVQEGEARLGCVYDEDQATFVYNNLLPLLFGFFEYYPVFFPNGRLSEHAEMEFDVADAQRWIDASMKGQAKAHPKSREWLELIDAIVRLPRT